MMMQVKTFLAIYGWEFKDAEDSPFKIREGFLQSDRIAVSWEGPLLPVGVEVYLGDEQGTVVKVKFHQFSCSDAELYIDCVFEESDLERLMRSAIDRGYIYSQLIKQGWKSLDSSKIDK